MASDRELLERWGAGDGKAGATLFDRHYASIFRFFRSKGTRDIEDLVQETFLALTRSRDAFRGEASFRSFLFGTARNILRQHCRRHRRKEGNVDFGTHSVMDLDASPSAIVADRAEKRLLLEGLRRLPVDDQIVIELFLWENMTALELGAVLNLTEPAVRSRLYRAKARLRDIMTELAESPAVLESTLSDLEAWAAHIRDQHDAADA